MYINIQKDGEDSYEALRDSEYSFENKSEYLDEGKDKFIKISQDGVKTANHVLWRIAKNSDAFIPSVRLLIDVKWNDTFEYIKEIIVDQ